MFDILGHNADWRFQNIGKKKNIIDKIESRKNYKHNFLYNNDLCVHGELFIKYPSISS